MLDVNLAYSMSKLFQKLSRCLSKSDETLNASHVNGEGTEAELSNRVVDHTVVGEQISFFYIFAFIYI